MITNIKNHICQPVFFLSVLLLSFSACDKTDSEPNNPYNGKTQVKFNPKLSYGTVVDQEGNEYKTIKIGEQIWMAENLRTTVFRNGDSVTGTVVGNNWFSSTSPLYTTYKGMYKPESIATYGRLYNWYAAADERNIAPEGWRIPTLSDWETIKEYLLLNNFNSAEESKFYQEALAKSLATEDLWDVIEVETESAKHFLGSSFFNDYRNKSGFSAVPTGIIFHKFENQLQSTGWWCLDEYSIEKAACSVLDYNRHSIAIGAKRYKNGGYSIRCIQED